MDLPAVDSATAGLVTVSWGVDPKTPAERAKGVAVYA